MQTPGLRKKIFLVVFSISITLVSLEIVFRILEEPDPYKNPVCKTCNGCPYLFHLNPDHPETSEQGLRDRLYQIPKPADVTRILVLGDSVVYGPDVKRSGVFTEVLEENLNAGNGQFEVINAGISGYTTYNQYQYYVSKGRLFEPDIVLSAVCLNDIVDPYVHWNQYYASLTDLPREAYPNYQYHEKVMEKLKQNNITLPYRMDSDKNRSFSSLLDFIRRSHFRKEKKKASNEIVVGLTMEDNLPITTWLEDDAPEWIWFTDLCRKMAGEVSKSNAQFGVIIFPLEYQVNENYPFRPQARISLFCEQEGYPCLDLLFSFRKYAQHHPQD